MRVTKKIKEEQLRILSETYRGAKTALNFTTPFELLIAVILSAQCTDARVNIVTETLFKKYPSISAFATANQKELEEDIKPAGFQRNKAANIIGCCKRICDEFGGEVPRTIEELTSLPGVGRKTANVIRTHIFEIPSIVVDTHVLRTTKRLGLSSGKNAAIVEKELEKMLPKEH